MKESSVYLQNLIKSQSLLCSSLEAVPPSSPSELLHQQDFPVVPLLFLSLLKLLEEEVQLLVDCLDESIRSIPFHSHALIGRGIAASQTFQSTH